MGSATRKIRRRDINNLPEREQQRRKADPLELQVLNLSDKIVDLAIANTGGPGLAVIGVMEALCRVALSAQMPDVRNMLHFQMDALLDDLIPKFRAENARQATG